MKKHLIVMGVLLVSVVALSVLSAPSALAAAPTSPPCPDGAAFCALAPIPGLTDTGATSVVQSQDLTAFINNLYKYLIGLAAAFAIIEIIWGGLEIATKDSVSKQSDGKARIQQALFGLLLVLSPVVVFSVINPSILNLSLNLPTLDTQTASTTPFADGSTAATAGECTTTHSGAYLEQASCPTQAAASSYRCRNGADPVITCVKKNDGTCITGKETVNCGKTEDVVFYATSYISASFLTGFLSGSGLPVPRDVPAAQTFNNGCIGDGGYAWQKADLSSLASARGGNCINFGSDTGVNTLPSPAPGRYACYIAHLSCLTDAPATDHTVTTGKTCLENRQCQTGYCNLQTSPGTCTNAPDISGNECVPGPNPPVGLACPSGQSCVSSADNIYRCAAACIKTGYSPPAGFDISCPDIPQFQKFCPTGPPAWNECKMMSSGSVRFAVCFNLSEQTGCLVANPVKISDILRQAP